MAVSLRRPEPRFARFGANPTLETIEYVRAALRGADAPMSRNRLLAILKRWGHSTTRPSLNAAINFLGSDGNIVEGSKGLVWVNQASGKLLETIRSGRRL